MITGFLQMNAAIDRFNGYKQALLEAGIAVDNNLIAYGDYTQESGYVGMKQLLEVNPRPTAEFTGNDMMGLGALRAIHEAGLEVPGDISIVGFDDVPMAAYANPPLTTMRQPIAEMGALAANTLIDQLENIAQPGAHIRLPTQLVVRQSSGPARS